MTGSLLWTPQPRPPIPNGQYNMFLREPRLGCMLHFDASGSDAGAVAWFSSPDCKVSYNWLVLDDGTYVEIAPPAARARHAGYCRPSSPRLAYKDANSAFYGIAAATNERTAVTLPQLFTVAWLARRAFEGNNWPLDEKWRLVGHSSEAWPRGRKIDPEGSDPLRPILRMEDVRLLLTLFGAP